MDSDDRQRSSTSSFEFNPERFFLHLGYLLLSFPLGIFYFVFLVTGLAVGLGLAIIWIGILILALVLTISMGLAQLERGMAATMLGAAIHPRLRPDSVEGFWSMLKSRLSDPVTWKGVAFLFLKFPLGIISFVLTISLVSLSLSLILAPFAFSVFRYDFYWWRVDSLEGALLCSLVGVLIGIGSFYVLTGLAVIWRELAVLLLGSRQEIMPESPAGDPLTIR